MMPLEPLARRLLAEGPGRLLPVRDVIGSGIMAEALAGGNMAVALLGNTLATGAILFVLITILEPVSGAQMNPAVTLVRPFAAGSAGATPPFMSRSSSPSASPAPGPPI